MKNILVAVIAYRLICSSSANGLNELVDGALRNGAKLYGNPTATIDHRMNAGWFEYCQAVTIEEPIYKISKTITRMPERKDMP